MPSSQHDDLTSIKGIGPKGAEALREQLGIESFTDLAASSPELIRRAHEDAGLARPSEATAAAWITDAAAEAAKDGDKARPTSPALGAGDGPPTRALHGWEPYATFMVEFLSRDVVHRRVEHQVVVREAESDHGERFALEEGARAFAWMREQLEIMRVRKRGALSESLEEAPEAASAGDNQHPADEEGQAARETFVEIRHVDLYQPPRAARPLARADVSHPNLGVARVGEPVVIEVEFAVDPERIDELAEAGVTYTVEAYFQAWDSGSTVHVGPTPSEPTAVATELYAVPIRHAFDVAGLYRAQCVVTLSTDPPLVELLEIPLLQAY